MRYPRMKEGQWFRPRRRAYYMQCCDCGLVHRLNFRLVRVGRGRIILIQAFRLRRRG